MKKIQSLLAYLHVCERTFDENLLNSHELTQMYNDVDEDYIKNMERYVEKRGAEKTGKKNPLLKLVDLILWYNSHDADDLLSRIAGKDKVESQKFINEFYGKRTYYMYYDKATKIISCNIIGKTWQELTEEYEPEPDMLDVTTSYQVITRWFQDQNIDIEEFLSKFMAVANKTKSKLNSLGLFGQSNAGKSLIMRSLIQVFKALAYLSQGTNYNFLWQDCDLKRAIIWEEPMIDMTQIETLKLVMEGARTTVHQKCKGDAIIERTPLFFTGNRPLWDLVPSEEKMLKNRMYLWERLKPLDWLKEVNGALNPKAWLMIYDDMTTFLEGNEQLTPEEVTLMLSSDDCAGVQNYIPDKIEVEIDEEGELEKITKTEQCEDGHQHYVDINPPKKKRKRRTLNLD